MRLPYEPPALVDEGALWETTESHSLLVGRQVVQIATILSLPVVPGHGVKHVTESGGFPIHGSGTGGVSGVKDVNATGGANPSGAGTGAAHGAREIRSGGGSGGGGGGGGSKLPFTGFAVVLTAGIGAALAGVGAGARRLTRRA